MSLLDDVSIVVTPNGYKAGELYAVIPVPTEGAEEITNGDFDGGTTDWNLGNAVWQQGSGNGEVKLTKPSSGNSVIYQTGLTFAANTVLRYRFDIVDYSGSPQIRIDGYSVSNPLNTPTSFIPSEGNVDVYITTDRVGSSVFLYLTGGSVGDYVVLDNVSVKEWTGADMDVTRATAATRVDENGLVNYAEVIGGEEVTNGDFATNINFWEQYNSVSTWDNGSIKTTSNSTVAWVRQNDILSTGNVYKITFKAKASNISQNLNIWNGATFIDTGLSFDLANVYKEFTYTLNFTGSGGQHLILGQQVIGSGDSINFDNVSVKEVTRDNVPRIDYTGGGCPHILAEPQRTNLLPYSEDFSQWTAISGASVAINTAISPNGETDADTITFDGTTYGRLEKTTAVTNGNTYSFSVYLKNNNLSDVTQVWLGFSQTGQGEFVTITNEWQRYETVQVANGSNEYPRVQFTGTGSLYAWGAQLEEGSYATSYIPTSGSTVTRNQDIFTRDGIGSLIGSEGVLFIEMAALSNDLTNRVISLNDGTSSNRLMLYFNSLSNTIAVVITSGGSTINYAVSDETSFNKMAVRYRDNDLTLWVDGQSRGTPITSATIPTFTALKFDSGIGASPFYGKVRQLQVYNTALTDEQLLQLTGTSGTDFYESYAEMASALTYTIQ